MAEPMPSVRPGAPFFSSGPCAKRPGWNLQVLADAALGRSHRAKLGLELYAQHHMGKTDDDHAD